MRIETDRLILSDKQQIINNIAHFWDKISQSWHDVWGKHIHHGYYDHNSHLTPAEAQEKLIQQLAQYLNIETESQILDVGCGMGASAVYLANHYQAHVMGITLSEAQLNFANTSIPEHLQSQIQFKIEDAHNMIHIPSHHYDIVWSLESCEQFYNKELFIMQAFRVLKKGGKLMLATWCSDQEYYEGHEAKKYIKLCKSFDLPYLPTMNAYLEILHNYGQILSVHDWSSQVKTSWDVGMKMLKKHSYFKLVKMSGMIGLKFLLRMKLLRKAFLSGQLRYGVFIVQK